VLRHLLVAHEAGMAMLPQGQVDGFSAPDRAYLSDVNAGIEPLYQLTNQTQAELDALRRRQPPRQLLLLAAADVCTAVAQVNEAVARRCDARVALARARLPAEAGAAAAPTPAMRRIVEEVARLGETYEAPLFFRGLLRAVQIGGE
jgi:hypothetical protein